jgi:hypothetical protein
MCGDATAKLNPIADLIPNLSALACSMHARAMPGRFIDTDVGYRHQNR